MSGAGHRRDDGFSLIEVLVTVVIVGITFAVFVGGMGVSFMAADKHRKQTTAQAGIRNFGEAIKAASYVDCATTSSYAGAYTPTPPTRNAGSATLVNVASHVAPSVPTESTNGLLLTFFGLAAQGTFSAPSGMTEVSDLASVGAVAPDGVTATIDERFLTTDASTGSRTATSSTAADSTAQAVVLERSSGAVGGIVRHGVSSLSVVATPTLALAKPANTAAGDAMIAHVVVRGGSGTKVSAPAGWILVASVDRGTAVKSLVYERTAASGANDSWTWTFDAARTAAGAIVSYGRVSTSFTATITAVKYWNGSSFVASCPSPDAGLQLVSLRTASADGAFSETVDMVKRKP